MGDNITKKSDISNLDLYIKRCDDRVLDCFNYQLKCYKYLSRFDRRLSEFGKKISEFDKKISDVDFDVLTKKYIIDTIENYIEIYLKRKGNPK